MTQNKNITNLILLLILFGTFLTYAIAEDNYKTYNNLLTNIYEATLTENGYKANIIINPHAAGIYAQENGYKLDFAITTQGIGGALEENGYKLDLVPEKSFPEKHDTSITTITTSKTIIGQGYTLKINITTTYEGDFTQTYNIITYANTTIINTQVATLTNKNSLTLTLTWDTTDFTKGNYAISAYAWPIPGETHTANNRLTYGIIYVGIPGDVASRYGQVDMKDIGTVVKTFGSVPGQPRWSANCDINCDGKVDMKDIGITVKHFGQTDP